MWLLHTHRLYRVANKKIQRTRNKRGLLLALVGARAADLGR